MKNLSELLERVKFQELPGILVYDNVQNEDYPTHWHSSLEIIMPIENEFHVQCDMEEYNLREGDILIICPGEPHFLHAAEGRRLIIQADLSGGKLVENLDSFFPALGKSAVIMPEEFHINYAEIKACVMNIFLKYFGTEPFRGVEIVSNLMRIFALVADEYIVQEEAAQNVKSDYQRDQITLMMKICQYIREHCTENLTLEATAAMAGFSKYHFSRKFKEIVGISFYKYLNHCRISKAEKLMEKPSNSITDVAIMSGFNSISAFIRMFKIINGCTPNEFRSRNK